MADHPAEIELARLNSKLRAWAKERDTWRAAVELLIWHDGWLRRDSFRQACIADIGTTTCIRWHLAREYADKVTAGGLDAPRASTSEAAILDLAVAIGEDRFRLANMGSAHRRAVVAAVAQAVGLPG